ncbi:hypothetical protein D3C75_949420 [compost metagenome]
MTGAIIRTLPETAERLGSGEMICAVMPFLSLYKSVEVTSARHSKRLSRIKRNSSCPVCANEPTVAVRAEITP